MNYTINLEKEILTENTAVLEREQVHLDDQKKLDREVEKVLAQADRTYTQDLMAELGFDYKNAEAKKIQDERTAFAVLPQNRIMGLSAIKAVCLKYGLRFLPTRYYKGALDAGIGPKLEEFRALIGGKLPVPAVQEAMSGSAPNPGTGKPQMYIAAPSASFALQPIPKDPLLFCRLSMDKFFLLHKWGNDLTKKETENHDIRDSNWNSPTIEVERHLYTQAYANWAASTHVSGLSNVWPGTTGNSFTVTSGGPSWTTSLLASNSTAQNFTNQAINQAVAQAVAFPF